MKYLLSILTFCCVLFLGLNSSFANYQAGSLTAKQQAIILLLLIQLLEI